MKTKSLVFCGITTFVLSSMLSCSKKDEKPRKVQLTISEEIKDSIWSAGSEVTITGNVTLPKGKKLKIEEGVSVIFATNDTITTPEFVILGDLYVNGTVNNPVKFSIPENKKAGKTYGGQWGGLLAGPDCNEMLINHAIIEYAGARTTSESPSITNGLYKKAGDVTPAIFFTAKNGKLVVTNTTFHNIEEDGMYITGGNILIANNRFITTGRANGDAVNTKVGVNGDVCFNIFFSNFTNGIKTASEGGSSEINFYNNTIVNTGWRRSDVKGGSIWMEKGVTLHAHNNLVVNSKFGLKRSVGSPENSKSTNGNNAYYGVDSVTVAHFQINATLGVVGNTENDVRSNEVKANDPKFVNFDPATIDKLRTDFDFSWDFRLKSDSPCLKKGNTSANSHYSTTGLTLDGKVYKSPAPADYIGAKGTN